MTFRKRRWARLMRWHRWFAWHPVEVDRTVVWLSFVLRRGAVEQRYASTGRPASWKWEYATDAGRIGR